MPNKIFLSIKCFEKNQGSGFLKKKKKTVCWRNHKKKRLSFQNIKKKFSHSFSSIDFCWQIVLSKISRRIDLFFFSFSAYNFGQSSFANGTEQSDNIIIVYQKFCSGWRSALKIVMDFLIPWPDKKGWRSLTTLHESCSQHSVFKANFHSLECFVNSQKLETVGSISVVSLFIFLKGFRMITFHQGSQKSSFQSRQISYSLKFICLSSLFVLFKFKPNFY